MSSYILRGLMWLGRKFLVIRGFIPKGFLAIFVIITFFIDLFKEGLGFAFKHLAEQLLAAELVINKTVKLAIANDPSYNFGAFLSIISSVMIIYFFVKFIGKFLQAVTGAQAPAMSYVVGLLIFGIIEISAVKIIDGNFGFIPIYSGLWFLLMNLQPVFSNITFL